MLALGIFTRPTAFILSGEMAVAYFRSWAPRGFFPIANGGEEATLNAHIFLCLPPPGPCVESGAHSREAGPECAGSSSGIVGPQVRAILRLIVGFLLTLHGIRKLFDVPPSVAAVAAHPLALDSLRHSRLSNLPGAFC